MFHFELNVNIKIKLTIILYKCNTYIDVELSAVTKILIYNKSPFLILCYLDKINRDQISNSIPKLLKTIPTTQ